MKVLQRGGGRKLSEAREQHRGGKGLRGKRGVGRKRGGMETSKKERSNKLGCLNIGTLTLMHIF